MYRLSGQTLELPPKAKVDGTVPAAATAVAVSHCGNFGIVGTANGRMDKYNMQSALHRGTFKHPGMILIFKHSQHLQLCVLF